MIDKILSHYKQIYPYCKFYENLLSNISKYTKDYISSKTFLTGFIPKENASDVKSPILTKVGDIRVDLPVWFGNPESKIRVVIIGLEPRDTDKTGKLNIERSGDFVFGTPFALERPKGPYYSAFWDIINNDNALFYFTDVVKEYHVIDHNNKNINDKLARQCFLENAEKGKDFLLAELNIIKPNLIIALGNKSFNFMNSFLNKDYIIKLVRHPSQGGAIKAREQLSEILLNLY